jgi:catechol 2,3-dioxygenase-like lactoylglutathione lyase family enzyme
VYLSYFGIRVTDLPRSIDFYTRHFGLTPTKGTELPHDPPKDQTAVLLIDPRSGQRLELNFYPVGNPYAVPYVAGEGWDHLAFRVDDLERFLDTLRKDGIQAERMAHFDGPMMSTPNFRVAYIRDPDGNQIELFDTPKPEEQNFDRDRY